MMTRLSDTTVIFSTKNKSFYWNKKTLFIVKLILPDFLHEEHVNREMVAVASGIHTAWISPNDSQHRALFFNRNFFIEYPGL